MMLAFSEGLLRPDWFDSFLFIMVPIFIVVVFVFVIISIISPKFRGKTMARQIKALKYMAEESKDAIADITEATSGAVIKGKKKVLDENEDTLKEMAIQEANIDKERIEITTRAIKKGLTAEKMYCKHCGASIDGDSKFCKKCGKAQ